MEKFRQGPILHLGVKGLDEDEDDDDDDDDDDDGNDDECSSNAGFVHGQCRVVVIADPAAPGAQSTKLCCGFVRTGLCSSDGSYLLRGLGVTWGLIIRGTPISSRGWLQFLRW